MNLETQPTEASLQAVMRSQGYRLLSAALRRPTDAHLRRLKEEWPQGWREVLEVHPDGSELRSSVEAVAEMLASEGLLLSEYDRLFEPHAGLAVSPFETELLKTPQEALVQGARLADVSGFYKAFGLEVSAVDPERCDHIASELEFMHFLAFKEAVSHEEGEPGNFDIVRDAERKFMVDHLGRWPGILRNKLIEADALPYFQRVADLLETWVEADARSLGVVDEALDDPEA